MNDGRRRAEPESADVVNSTRMPHRGVPSMPDENSNTQHPNRADQLVDLGKKLIETITGSVTGEITKAMAAIADVAGKGTIVFLQSFGAALIVFCLAMKIEVGSKSLGHLTRSEYITTIVAGFVFVIAGTCIRFYILKSALDAQKSISQAGQEIMKVQAGAANRQLEKITGAGISAIRSKPELPPGV